MIGQCSTPWRNWTPSPSIQMYGAWPAKAEIPWEALRQTADGARRENWKFFTPANSVTELWPRLASDFLSNRCGRASFNTRYMSWLSGRSARCASSTCANWQILVSISPDMKHSNMARRKRSRPPRTFSNSTACWYRVHDLRVRIWGCLQAVFRTPDISSL